MAWDTERTRRLLLDAATREFADHGLAGGRVDRIAEVAGVNKQRIYKYFGSKSELFDAVVANEMVRVMELIPITGTGKSAVLDYAGRMFDHHSDDRTLARLLFWESLSDRPPTRSPERIVLSDKKVDDIARVLPGIPRPRSAELLFAIVVLSCGWPILEQIDRLLVGKVGDRSRRRDMLIKTVGALVSSLSEESGSA
jgi:AcrR family transcriptional regulator